MMCVVGVWRLILDLWCACTLCWSRSHSGSQTSTVAIVIIECISWLIKVTDSNDAWWKPESSIYLPVSKLAVLFKDVFSKITTIK